MLKNLFSQLLSVRALLLIVIVHITACSEQAGETTQAAAQPSTPPAAENREAPNPAAPSSAIPASKTGLVKSAQVAGSYSYIETDIDGSTFWIATAATAVKAGEKISWNDYAMMKNFTSKALNKTFDQIMFVDKIRTAATQVTSAHTGTVVETVNASGYSYIQVDEQGKKVWLAAPQMVINVGQTINWTGGAAMQNFSSRALDRTFDEIYFVGAVQIING